MSSALAFDVLAADYDRHFTHTDLGRRMRAAVWRRLDARFGPGDRVLEINCGTGEDAVYLGRRGVHVLATDAAPAMVDIARAKVEAAGVGDRVIVECRSMADVDGSLGPFDGVLSNFGGLNCVDDVDKIAEALASVVRPGGVALLGVMGPVVPWEWVWHLAHGSSRRAFRRLRRGGVPWRGLTVRYHTPRRLCARFARRFTCDRLAAIGALMPPTEARHWVDRHPRTTDALERIERRCETWWPLPYLADHYLAELRRRDR